MDTHLIQEYPNKYGLTPKSIKMLVIKDWNRLKKLTWHNEAMKNTGSWWCHLEGCQLSGRFNDDSEFWIGFREEDNKIDCSFSCYEGMCKYIFDTFYDLEEIDNQYDLNVQVNTIRWLNSLIDEGVLTIPEVEKC